jgi:2-keto-4-pentenoate hydratase/2-oxohepta-3-ene-1,7-dioic acid hydratase in catechol pathway
VNQAHNRRSDREVIVKYASFVVDGVPTWGVERDGRLVDLGPSGGNVASSIKELIADERFPLADVAFDGAPTIAVERAEFLPPIADPGKILCVGVNYRTHQEESSKPTAQAPTIFVRFADSQMGHGAPAVYPRESDAFDYEGELALVIGRDAYRVPSEEAWSVIAGYSIYNDFSVRDWQTRATQWTPGKNFPGTGAFGPYLVPAENIEDVTALRLETRVNGEVRQSATVTDLIFSIPEIIAYVTTFTKLSPGDVIVTGTPGGVGLFMEPKGLLRPDDVVEVEITDLGVLTNTVTQR